METALGLTAAQIGDSLDILARRDPALARAIAASGRPGPRVSEPGYPTLLRTIVGQQLSVASARAVWNKLGAAIDVADPVTMAKASDEALRAAGLSRQKAGYARSLAGLVASGELDLARLPTDDEEAIAQLVQVKGIGRWSAEIYLLFAEGRPDIWPAGDLAVQVAVGLIADLKQRPSEKDARELAEPWRPHRGAAAIFAWHHYGQRARAAKGASPL